MFSLLTRTNVEDVSGREITDFLSGCNDAAFKSWWPGTIGDRRVKVRCELGETRAGQDTRFRLPVRLVLRLNDDDTGLQIEQLIEAGTCCCKSRPHVQAALSTSLAAAKDEHVRTEFPKIARLPSQKNHTMCRC